MAEELEDKYSRFNRNTGIDLLAEIAAGGSGGGLDNYYTKTESDAITDALDVRVTDLEASPGGGVTDHGELTGLADDDHTQYHNDTRGDARYYTKTQTDTALNEKTDATDTPRYLMFNTTWPSRPADSRMTFYIGGDPDTNAPADSIAGDVWIPTPAGL